MVLSDILAVQRRRRGLTGPALWLLLPLACACDGGSPRDPTDAAPEGGQDGGGDDLACGADVLLLVDGTPTMAPWTAELARRVPELVASLVDEGVDARVAVATPWVGVGTRLLADSPCPYDGPFFVDRSEELACARPVFAEGEPRWLEVSAPDAAARLACVADPDTESCIITAPFFASRALVAWRCRTTSWCEGFFRREALLSLLVLTNKDDCEAPGRTWPANAEADEFYSRSDPSNWGPDDSLYWPCAWRFDELLPVEDALSALEESSPLAEGFVLSVAAGTDERPEVVEGDAVPSCDPPELDRVLPAPRLHEAVRVLGDRARIRSLCDGPSAIGNALEDLVELIVRRQDPACLTR